ncbi:hypothetical protein BCR36DRAFT_368245 [Piromyces finnis]|uniref:Talin N-terminal F0 domain-containing protein n=1 Tax=Piromyces finnis TaxID=1754191 RepID=A0A1Y1VGH0_9FUNG|nr:hypothetical protein BCR36DRAFT_368245 [Piromyces finnis]|eukprot:ORX55508.1 hypothetical protein BCR36DRAFT_368245 [Piromyces finnis]
MVYLILKVTIPDLNFVKTLKVNNKERIYRIKEDIIKKCGKNENLLNYGFLLKDDHQSSIFLSESKILEDYNIDEKSKLEFVMRKRLNIEYTDTSSNTLSSKHQKKFIEEIQKKLYDKLAERLSKNFDPNFCTETGGFFLY